MARPYPLTILSLMPAITPDVIGQARRLTGQDWVEFYYLHQFIPKRHQKDLMEMIAAGDIENAAFSAAELIGWSPEEWRSRPLLIIPPMGLAGSMAFTVEIAGRCGYLPPLLPIRRFDPESITFEVGGTLDLQKIFERARKRVEPAEG